MQKSKKHLTLEQYGLSAIGLVLIIPFLIKWGAPPYNSLYHDFITIAAILFLVIIIAKEKWFYLPLSRPVIYLLILAVYWALQIFLIKIPYPEVSIRTSLLFVAIAFLVWGIQILIDKCGHDVVFTWVMWAVVISSCLQMIVAVLQLTGTAKYVSLLVANHAIPIGQYGQRNLLGHQIMWTLPALSFLFCRGKLGLKSFITLLFFCGCVLGFVSSRTIVLYLLSISILLIVAFLMTKGQIKKERLFLSIASGVLWILIAQLLMPIILEYLGYSQQSGLLRLAHSTHGGERLSEWHKAWLVFKDFPIFGAGWKSYTHHSLVQHGQVAAANIFREASFFSHCHNAVLQILAEMGIVGLFLVFGGLCWLVLPIFKNWRTNYHSTILLLLAISSCHSMLEYPLWYSFFFAAFLIFIALGQPESECRKTIPCFPQNFLIGISSLILMAYFSLIVLHQWRIMKYLKQHNGQIPMLRAEILAEAELGSVFPLLNKYHDLAIIAALPTNGVASAENFSRAKQLAATSPIPFVSLYYGFNLYHQSKIKESINWMHKTWFYYPRHIPYSMKLIYDNSPKYKALEQPVYDMCVAYLKTNLYPKVFVKECKKPPK